MENLLIRFEQSLFLEEFAFHPKLHRKYDPVETKSTQLSDDGIYLVVQNVVEELYRHNFLRHENLSFQDVKFIKHLAIYICHVVMGHSMRKIAQGIGLDRTSVSYACRKIEDKRDDYEAELFISLCERLIGILMLPTSIKEAHQLHVV